MRFCYKFHHIYNNTILTSNTIVYNRAPSLQRECSMHPACQPKPAQSTQGASTLTRMLYAPMLIEGLTVSSSAPSSTP